MDPLHGGPQNLNRLNTKRQPGTGILKGNYRATINEIYELEIGPNRCSISNTQQQQHQVQFVKSSNIVKSGIINYEFIFQNSFTFFTFE